MDFAGLLETYGYLALALGMFLEGEAVLIMAGFAASRGHLALPAVIVVAALASFAADQLYFLAGRRYGSVLLSRMPSLQTRAARASVLVQRHHLPLILSIRFLYGLRTAALLALGMSQVTWPRFCALSFISATAWASSVGSAGYLFGRTLERLLAGAGYYQYWIIGTIVALVMLWFGFSRFRRLRTPGK
ncbi:MAG: DedA family protein [Pseudomonadota bacterium]